MEAIVYQEILEGRIAALYHKNGRFFSGNWFILIPKAKYESPKSAAEREIFQFVFEDSFSPTLASVNRDYDVMDTVAWLKVRQALSNVDEVPLLQSEDRGCFLRTAFHFISRTSQTFLRTISKDYETNAVALLFSVNGKQIEYTHVTFSSSADETK